MNPLLPAPSLEPITQEVLAWRGWSLNWAEKEQGWFLYSVNHDVRWDGPSLMADKVPDSQNTHGIYALADKGQLLLQGYGTQVLGEVALSGIVVEGERGYRAERATIRNLVVFGYPRPDVRPIEILVELENRYQCEVRWEQANESLYSADKAAIIQKTINSATQYGSAPIFCSIIGSSISSIPWSNLGGMGNALGSYGFKI